MCLVQGYVRVTNWRLYAIRILKVLELSSTISQIILQSLPVESKVKNWSMIINLFTLQSNTREINHIQEDLFNIYDTHLEMTVKYDEFKKVCAIYSML